MPAQDRGRIRLQAAAAPAKGVAAAAMMRRLSAIMRNSHVSKSGHFFAAARGDSPSPLFIFPALRGAMPHYGRRMIFLISAEGECRPTASIRCCCSSFVRLFYVGMDACACLTRMERNKDATEYRIEACAGSRDNGRTVFVRGCHFRNFPEKPLTGREVWNRTTPARRWRPAAPMSTSLCLNSRTY